MTDEGVQAFHAQITKQSPSDFNQTFKFKDFSSKTVMKLEPKVLETWLNDVL